jgi:hypothetical protein
MQVINLLCGRRTQQEPQAPDRVESHDIFCLLVKFLTYNETEVEKKKGNVCGLLV